MLYTLNSLKIGLKVLQNNEPCVIINNECIKPGKGLSFNRVRFRHMISGKILERTLKSGEFLESANIREIKLVYLYRIREYWCFMNDKNFEQFFIHSTILERAIPWLVEQLLYIVTFWNDNPILVTPPDCIQVTVIKTTPVIKNASVISGSKLATISTGAIIKVPCFIQSGEFIKVNTHSKSYISRVK